VWTTLLEDIRSVRRNDPAVHGWGVELVGSTIMPAFSAAADSLGRELIDPRA